MIIRNWWRHGLAALITLLPLAIMVFFAWQDLTSKNFKDAAIPLTIGFASSALFYQVMMNVFRVHQFDYELRNKSIDYINMWHSGSRSEVAEKAGQIRKNLLNKSAQEIQKHLNKNDDDRQNLTEILNFLETLALSIKYKCCDEEIVREFYKQIIKTYWDTFGDWIKNLRKVSPDAFTELEWLHDRWRA